MSEDSLVIVLLDWNIVKGRGGGYQGHFVPVVGYDDEKVYVHNHGLNGPEKFLDIDREFFDRARRVEGTDEDIVVVWRKKLW